MRNFDSRNGIFKAKSRILTETYLQARSPQDNNDRNRNIDCISQN